MYKSSDEWQDIKKKLSNDFVNIVKIPCSNNQSQEIFDYFWAIIEKNELSERALELSTHAIRHDAINYNWWIFRRKILKSIKFDLTKEMCFCEDIITKYPKNFQAWEHRRSIAKTSLNLIDVNTELFLTEMILQSDAKNYFAWQHRQWTLQTFKFTSSGLMREEFEFTDKMINEDIRNNSAWSQRFFVLKFQGKYDSQLIIKEICFVVEKIKKVYNNESSWNYLRGVIDHFPNARKLKQFEQFVEFLNIELQEKKTKCPQLIGFLIDMKIDFVVNCCESSEMTQTNKIQHLCLLMSEQYDQMHANYWRFVSRKLLFDKSKTQQNDENQSRKNSTNWKYKIWKKVEENQYEEYFLCEN